MKKQNFLEEQIQKFWAENGFRICPMGHDTSNVLGVLRSDLQELAQKTSLALRKKEELTRKKKSTFYLKGIDPERLSNHLCRGYFPQIQLFNSKGTYLYLSLSLADEKWEWTRLRNRNKVKVTVECLRWNLKVGCFTHKIWFLLPWGSDLIIPSFQLHPLSWAGISLSSTPSRVSSRCRVLRTRPVQWFSSFAVVRTSCGVGWGRLWKHSLLGFITREGNGTPL